ncbi:hypothetical protein ACVWW1_009888 [Bradyrhizobium sp. JR3.5]
MSFVRPPLLMVVVEPVLVPRVELMVSVGAVVSTVAVTAGEVVVTLPALSAATAVKLWLPSESAAVVKLQLPLLTVAAPRSVAPSKM